MRSFITLLGACALLASLASPTSAATYPAGFDETILANGLDKTSDATQAPDGRIFIAEQNGRVKVLPTGSSTATTILDISSRVNSYDDRGLVGIAVDSDFAHNNYLWLLYSYELAPLVPDSLGPTVSRLSRVTVSPTNVVGPETVILGTYSSGACPSPSNTSDCIPGDATEHVVGTVYSAPDGTLWLGSGDASSSSFADPRALRTYDEQSFAGKIIHIDRNGFGLPGHPFCPGDTDLSHVCTKLYSKGHRNPFRFFLRSNGSLVVGDVGWNTREEVDLIPPGGGRNYGWPCYEGVIHTPNYSGMPECAAEYAKEGTANADTPPDYDYPHNLSSAAVVGGPEYTGTQFPAAYRNTIFIGDYAFGFIRRLVLDAQGRVSSAQDFASNWFGGTDLEQMPDGSLLYTAFGNGNPGTGSLRKITFSTTNHPPTAAAAATPSSGAAPLLVTFSSAGSSDPDGDTLTYLWDFGDGSATSTQANPSHTYASAGVYTARLTVNDARGGTDSKTVQIGVNNTAPTVTINAPTDNALFQEGDTVALSGSATDTEEGALPASALRWRVTLHHADHIHPVTDLVGTAQATFTTQTDHDADSYYEIVLTATDSSGLSGSKTVNIRPQTIALNLQSSPAGAPMAYAGRAVTAPFSAQAAIGFRTTVSADSTFAVGGRLYGFDSWSDGGAATHNITIPTSATTLTATYRDIGPSGLVAAYGFDETTGTSVGDASGSGNAGSIGGGALRTASGKYGGAISFDGVNDMVTVPDSNSLDLKTGMTLEAWINPTVASGWRTAILKETTNDLVYALYGVSSYGGLVRPSSWISSSGDIGGTGAPPTGQWTHLATTYDGATWRLYVNGTQVASKAFALQIPTSTGALRIGGNSVWGEWFSGLIDEVRIYDHALSALEVARDQATPIGGASPPPPDTAPPSVSVTAPAAGALLRATATVTATASDNVGVAGVQFKVDGQNLGAEDTTAPYSVSWDTTTASNGSHTLTAVARDAATNSKTSADDVVTVDNQNPTVSVTSPAAGATVSGATVSVAASASDNVAVAGVQFRLDGQNLGAEDTTSPYSVTWDSTSATNGSHILTAVARDSAGNSATATTVSVTADNADNTPPSVSVTAPAAGALLRATATVTATASDNVGVAGVQFKVDGQNLGAEDTTAPYSVSWDTTTASNGSHTLTAVARDAATNSKTSADDVVTVDNQNPTVSVTSPAAGATVSGATVSVAASASDNVAVAGVQFRLDGQNLGAEDTTSPYSVTWDSTSATNGSHILTAVARDSAGNSATATTVTVTVTNAAPSGLVAAYGFEEPTGTSVNDSSGKGNTGTIAGGATRITTGKNGSALSFDGVNDIVNVADSNSLDLTTGMTLEAWVYPTALTGWRTAILKETTSDIAYALYAVSPRPSAWLGPDGLTGTAALPVNTWSHLASTYDGATWRLYVNGTQVATRAYTKAIPVSAGALRLGGNTIWSEWFQGRLDDVRIYNRGLAAAEVVRDRDAAVGP